MGALDTCPGAGNPIDLSRLMSTMIQGGSVEMRSVVVRAALFFAALLAASSISAAQSTFPVLVGGDSGDACGMKVKLKAGHKVTVWNGPWHLYPEMERLEGESYIFLCWEAPRPNAASASWTGIVYTPFEDNDCRVQTHVPQLIARVETETSAEKKCNHGWIESKDLQGERVELVGE
jgi:hypothetical protein